MKIGAKKKHKASPEKDAAGKSMLAIEYKLAKERLAHLENSKAIRRSQTDSDGLT